MKKLLYSGLTALMMLFAVGTAKADLPGGTEEDASVFTISPANGSTVASGTLLNVTAEGATMIVYYAFATEADADAKLESPYWNWVQADDYEEGKTAITEDECVFMLAAMFDGKWKYTRVSYTIETGDIANPKIYVNGQDITQRRITEADEITMDVPGNSSEDIDIWYTTDGSTPEKDGTASTKYTGKFTLTAGEVELKAIAVNSSNQTSSVVTVQFTVVTVASTTAQLYLMTTDNVEITDNTYGRYVSFLAMPMVQGEDGLEPAGDHAYVYYTVDGETEPSEEGFFTSDEDEGPVFRAAYGINPYDGAMEKPYITLTENSTILKVFAVAEDESGNERTTEVKTYDMTAIAVPTPSFDTPEGEVEAKAVVKVENTGNYARIYYTTDGSVPAYSRTRDWWETAVRLYDDETGIVIKKTTTINLIAYTADDNGNVKAGSDMITATYTVEEQGGGDEAVYGLVAVGATETTDEEANTFMQFTTPEPQFTITVPENAPEGWYATVVAYSIDPFGAVEGQTDTLRAGNATKTFSTLEEGAMYLCRAFVRDADNKKLWNNPGADEDGGLLFKIGSKVVEEKDTLPMPKFSVEAGEVTKGTTVTLSCDTAAAKIYYSINADTVTVNSLEYTAAIAIDSNMTIRAIAVLEDFVNSPVAEAAYTVKEDPVVEEKDTLSMPKFSVEAGEVVKGTTVALSCDTAAAKIYYSINADTVTENSLEYTTPIVIDSNMTIRAIAVLEDFVNSPVAEAAYTVKETANEGVELAGVNIYPNPTDGEFNVVAPANANVEIFNAAGVLVKRMAVAESKVQVRLDNSGIYFVRVRANGQAAIRKVVVR